MKRLLGLVALLAAAWLTRRREPVPEPLGNNKGAAYAVGRRAEALLDEAALAGAFSLAERRMVGVYARYEPDPADAIQVDPSLHERAGL